MEGFNTHVRCGHILVPATMMEVRWKVALPRLGPQSDQDVERSPCRPEAEALVPLGVCHHKGWGWSVTTACPSPS